MSVMVEGQQGGTTAAFYGAERGERFGSDGTTPKYEPLVRRLIAERLPTGTELRVVELGCGRSPLKDVHPGYIGSDFGAFPLRAALRGYRSLQADMMQLPIRDRSVDLMLSFNALEHVPRPELVLAEIDRVLKPGGVAVLAPAWFCRPWRASGINLKPYGALSWPDRARKASLVVRERLLFRFAVALPRRLARELEQRWRGGPSVFRYRRLTPNLTEYLQSDSDAFVSMDPHAMLIYWRSRRYKVDRADRLLHRVLWRRPAIVIQRAER